ncbi:hypothetical protein KFK09_026425 [Dendrobium nobile]|uniref:CCHC-type domain-containing protein n=1 Tax=Dendrobium nobile TaxID=94219 RepID=A0A8T3A7V7_DENNO|nr:hypothetical protein KFK09_026425 [Dendrobium nobile]
MGQVAKLSTQGYHRKKRSNVDSFTSFRNYISSKNMLDDTSITNETGYFRHMLAKNSSSNHYINFRPFKFKSGGQGTDYRMVGVERHVCKEIVKAIGSLRNLILEIQWMAAGHLRLWETLELLKMGTDDTISCDQDLGGIVRRKHVDGTFIRPFGPLVIKENGMEMVKKVSFVADKGKEIIGEKDGVSPGLVNNAFEQNPAEPMASSAEMNIYVNRFGNSNAISGLGHGINANVCNLGNKDGQFNSSSGSDVTKEEDKVNDGMSMKNLAKEVENPWKKTHCWDEVNVARITSSIGKPLMLDGNMFQWGKREFARVCVRVKLDQCLPLGVWVNSISGKFIQKFEYENILTLCYGCGMIGHLKTDCKMKSIGNSSKELQENKSLEAKTGKNTSEEDNEHTYGPWMMWLKVRDNLEEDAEKVTQEDNPVHKKIETATGDQLEEGEIPAEEIMAGSSKGIGCLEFAVLKAVNSVNATAITNGMSSNDGIPHILVNLNKFAVLKEMEDDGLGDGGLIPEDCVNNNNGNSPDEKNLTKGCEGNKCVVSSKKELVSRLSGGIMVIWRSDLASFSVLKTSNQCVIGEINVLNRGAWRITTVYASKDNLKRRELWDDVQENSNEDIPSIIGGDFNCILAREDKKGGRRFKFNQGSLEMLKFMNENDYHEVGFVGPRFTWCNNKREGDRILERLDRCILNTLSINNIQIAVARLKNFTLEKERLKGEILSLQDEESRDGWLDEENLWLLKAKVKELNGVLNNLNTWWKQRAKANWIKDGDANTKFFHSFASSRRNAKRISQVKDYNGMLTEDPTEIEEVFKRFLQGKWKYRNCSFSGWPEPWVLLEDSDKDLMNTELDEAEIKSFICNLESNKAPGIDGITHSFFKKFWEIIQKDVVKAVKQFFVTGLMNKDWKDTLVVLIPKSPNPCTPSAYRPISLCNSIYKIVAKILLNRMLKVLPRIISEEQAAFVKGRSIYDHLLLAQEVFNKMRFSRACDGFVAIKVDMEQAYDSMCWPTLEKMMLEMGFPIRFVQLILECITSPRDALYLHFFLSYVPNYFPMPLKAGIQMWTGQNINYNKSSLVCGTSVDRRRRVQISRLMGIKLVNEDEYLGIKLVLRLLRKDDFQVLLDKATKRINAWGNKFISLAGRLVLIKIVALPLPVFVMSHSLIPLKTLMEFEKICRDFIWNKSDGTRGFHYVAWEQLCKPKHFGGWNVHSVMSRRNAIRAKFAWKMIDKSESLLSRHLISKYGDNWWSYGLKRSSSPSWKIMVSGWSALKELVRWRIGDGSKIKVLKDVWILDKSLLKWPTYVVNFEDEDSSLDFFIEDGSWNREKLSMFFGPDLIELICNIKIDLCLNEDCMELKYKMTGKSLSALIVQDKCNNLEDVMPLPWVYKLGLNARLKVFIWRMVMNALPTSDFLYRRKLSDDYLCPWGRGTMEDINHISSNCSKLRNVLYVLKGWGFQLIQLENWVVNQSYGLSSNRWQPPPPDWIKINLDASIKKNYEAGIGGVVRDCKGRFLLAFGMKKTHWDIAQLELSAVSALREILRGRFDDVGGIIVEGDNKNAMEFLLNLHSIPKKFDRGLDIEDSSFLTKVKEQVQKPPPPQPPELPYSPGGDEYCEDMKGIIQVEGKLIVGWGRILEDLNMYSIDNLLSSLIAYEQGVNQRNLDAGEKKKEKIVALKAHKSDSDSSGFESDEVAFISRQFRNFLRKKQKHHWRKGKDSKYSKGSSDVVCYECRKPGHVKADFPTLQDHSSKEKEKGEEKPMFRKDKKRGQKAFWVESGIDSSEAKPEEETKNLYLMGEDHLGQSDDEEVYKPTYDELFEICEKIHASYKKLKKTHVNLKLELVNLQKEYEVILKDHSTIDSNHMALLDEFKDLNKKHSELIDENEALKVSHTSLQSDFKKSKEKEKNLRVENDVLKNMNLRIKNELDTLKKTWITPTLDQKPRPMKRHYNSNHLRKPFPGVRCFSCGVLGHISHTCTIHHSTHWVWRPKVHDSQHTTPALYSTFPKKGPKLV